MTCRTKFQWRRNRAKTWALGQVWGKSVDCPDGVRHVGGASLVRALARNVGTCRPDTVAGLLGRWREGVPGRIQPVESAQYTSIRYATRLLDAGALASIGSVGDFYDNAMAESGIGLYKTECVRHEGPWRGVDDLELATLSWVHWFNETRLHGSIGHFPTIEYETEYYRQNTSRQQPLPENPPPTNPGRFIAVAVSIRPSEVSTKTRYPVIGLHPPATD